MSAGILVSVIDDDESVRESIPNLLRVFGFAARAFHSAEAFLVSDTIEATKCLILDVAMPGMSGPELFEQLKQGSSDIPVIFITAHGNSETCRRLISLGAAACLQKPFDPIALIEALKNALRECEGLSMSDAETATEISLRQADATVFVVDDDVSVRESLAALVNFAGWRVLTFASAQAFLDHPRTPKPGCLLLDVSLPDLNGLELQERLGQEVLALPIIFITGHGDIPMSVRAMKAGAIEFLTKPLENDVLLASVAKAVEGSAAAIEAHSTREQMREGYSHLTARERQVLALISAGLLNKQVAYELGISEVTVKAHRGQVMRKMHARSFAELVNMFSMLGLSPTPRH